MLRELEAPAVRLGHRRIVLDTNDNPYAEAWFEKDLG